MQYAMARGVPSPLSWVDLCLLGRLFIRQFAISLLCLSTTTIGVADELTLSEFNGSGFDYTFGGFTQNIGPTSVRLQDPMGPTREGPGGRARSSTCRVTVAAAALSSMCFLTWEMEQIYLTWN